MAIFLKGKQEILEYFMKNGRVDITSIALSTIEYLIEIENMTIEDIAKLFATSCCEVKNIIERNGL